MSQTREQLTAQWQSLQPRHRELIALHDANSGTAFREETWYAEFVELDQQLEAILAEMKLLEDAGLLPDKAPLWFRDGPGNFPWDQWEQKAAAAGIDEELAGLGRTVYREAYNHAWGEELQAECGWSDGGDALLELALHKPDLARERWEYLLKTDGGKSSE